MSTSIKRNFVHCVSTIGFAAALTLAAIQPAEAQRQTLRFATANVSSYGYAVGNIISKTLQQNLGDDFAVVVQPFPSTTAAMKATMNGNAEFGYTADVGMRGLYKDDRPFKGFEPEAGLLVHTLYVYPMETFLVVPADSAGQYDSYGDLAAEGLFFSPAGFMNWINMNRVMSTLGYPFNHVEIDSATVSDSFNSGAIAGAAAYTTAGTGLPTWWREAELRSDISVVNPSEKEREKLRSSGLTPVEVDPSEAFSQDVGVETIWGVPLYLAYNVRADMDADLVHRILNILYKNGEQLAESDSGFRPLARDFVGVQVAGVAGNPGIPVHAGLAAFLKEHDAWNDSWIIAE